MNTRGCWRPVFEKDVDFVLLLISYGLHSFLSLGGYGPLKGMMNCDDTRYIIGKEWVGWVRGGGF